MPILPSAIYPGRGLRRRRGADGSVAAALDALARGWVPRTSAGAGHGLSVRISHATFPTG